MNELSPYSPRRTSLPSSEETAVFPDPMLGDREGVSLQHYWLVIRNHARLIITFLVGSVLATALTCFFLLTPLYTAETKLLIELNAPPVLNIQGLMSTESLLIDADHDFYKTQYEILASRALVAQVIRDQGLDRNGLFTGEGQTGFLAWLQTQAKAWGRWLSPPHPISAEENVLGVDPELIDHYLTHVLAIKPIRLTRLVKVAMSTADPGLSAHLANAHAQAYVHQGLQLRAQAGEEAQSFLEGKLNELKERIEKSEAALNRYRRDKGIMLLGTLGNSDSKDKDDKENIIVARLSDLNQRLTEAEADRITSEAQVRLIRKKDYDSLPAVVNSTLIETLKVELARLEAQQAHLATQFMSGYPRLAQLQAQVAEQRRRLNQAIQEIVRGIESAYLVAYGKEKELRAKLEKQKAETLRLKDDAVQYTILEREVDTNRQLYDNVLQRMKEMGVAAQVRASNVSIIEPAVPPTKPSMPKKASTLILSVIVGLMGGVGLAFVFEALDNTFKTSEEVERSLSLPNLSTIPDFTSLDQRSAVSRALPRTNSRAPSLPSLGKELPLAQYSLSLVMEAYRTLRTSILLSQAGEPPKILLFTSATEEEGKTTTVLNTAKIFAQMGVKVLVIDADLRRSDCHRVLRLQNDVGLAEVLTGQRIPQEVMRSINGGRLFFLSSGSIPPNPTELVSSRKMQEVLATLSAEYDYILIDSPPTMLVSDAPLLSTMVDGVVLVIGGQRTPRRLVQAACARLRRARAKILGVVLNRIDMRSGEYAYYRCRYSSYYDHIEAKEAE